MNELTELPSPYPGFPLYYWDPSEYEGPRFGKLAIGKFAVNGAQSFIYERVFDSRYLKPDMKTFIVIEMGGIENAFETGFGITLEDFDHERYRSILRSGSLFKWWSAQPGPCTSRWLFTDMDNRYMGLNYNSNFAHV